MFKAAREKPLKLFRKCIQKHNELIRRDYIKREVLEFIKLLKAACEAFNEEIAKSAETRRRVKVVYKNVAYNSIVKLVRQRRIEREEMNEAVSGTPLSLLHFYYWFLTKSSTYRDAVYWVNPSN